MKIICIGKNYVKHIQELNGSFDDNPTIFMKPDSSVIQKNQPFFIPEFSNQIHYELELILKFSKVGKHIAKEFAHKYYDEVGLGVDFTARDVQDVLKSKGLPWEKAKSFDGSAVIGKWVSKSNYRDLNELGFSLKKNNKVVQSSNSELMLWKMDELISYVSQFFTLKKGDIIFSGTPAGVGKVNTGDVLEGFIEDESFFKISVR